MIQLCTVVIFYTSSPLSQCIAICQVFCVVFAGSKAQLTVMFHCLLLVESLVKENRKFIGSSSSAFGSYSNHSLVAQQFNKWSIYHLIVWPSPSFTRYDNGPRIASTTAVNHLGPENKTLCQHQLSFCKLSFLQFVIMITLLMCLLIQ